MYILEIIEKKRKNIVLTKAEIEYIIKGYICEKFSDYQMVSLLMAISINELTKEEIKYIIDLIVKYSKKVYSKEITGKYVSINGTPRTTGNTFLLTGSILAALGVKISFITTDTILENNESLNNLNAFKVDSKMDVDLLTEQINKVGMSIICDDNILPSIYKKIYNLSLSTGTMSISLLVIGILVKNIILSVKNVVLDIRVGEHSFIRNKKVADKLINLLTEVGSLYKINVISVTSNLSEPLRDNYGPALENLEIGELLTCKNNQLKNLCIDLASKIYSDLYGKSVEEAQNKVNTVLENNCAYEKYKEFVNRHGGTFEYLTPSRYFNPIKSKRSGKIKKINIDILKEVLFYLKVYKKEPTDIVNLYSGVVLNKKIGDEVVNGEILCYLYQEEKLDLTNLASSIFDIE